MYVKRDADERIVLVSVQRSDDCSEYVVADAAELRAFVAGGKGADDLCYMRKSDLDFVRVLEDVVALLVDKGVISFADLPKEAQAKFSERQSMRRRMKNEEPAKDDQDIG